MADDTPEQQQNCAHRHLTKEVIFGRKTGDKVCMDCGEVFSPAELDEMKKKD